MTALYARYLSGVEPQSIATRVVSQEKHSLQVDSNLGPTVVKCSKLLMTPPRRLTPPFQREKIMPFRFAYRTNYSCTSCEMISVCYGVFVILTCLVVCCFMCFCVNQRRSSGHARSASTRSRALARTEWWSEESTNQKAEWVSRSVS